MSLSNTHLKVRLYAIALAILAFGSCAGLLLYVTGEEAAPEAIGYIVADGIRYPVAPNQSKRYVRDLERFGGKASVVFDEFDRWFSSLWQGTRLGITIFWLSVLVSVSLSLFARALPAD